MKDLSAYWNLLYSNHSSCSTPTRIYVNEQIFKPTEVWVQCEPSGANQYKVKPVHAIIISSALLYSIITAHIESISRGYLSQQESLMEGERNVLNL